MRVLVVGNGAREHALAWKLKQSPKLTDLFAAPGNPGMAGIATTVPIDASDIIRLREFASDAKVDLTVVGPELPLGLGLADEFLKHDLRVFGPTQAAAEIETSKVFAKRFLQAHGIPTASFEVATSPEQAEAILDRRGGRFPVAIKADGLAGGKGVVIARDRAEASAAVRTIMVDRAYGNAGAAIVIEDGLEGRELSFQVVTDGRTVVALAPARDYKRALDGDRGANTGGMGSLSPVRVPGDLGKEILERIVLPTVNGLAEEGRRFLGVLYVGLMLTADGPKVLEFNCRLGDPETQSVLPRLDSDLLELFQAACARQLDGYHIAWKKEVSVSVVAASGGYPGPFKTGFPISGVGEAAKLGAHVFHAGTAIRDGKLVSAAGRVVTVNACAPSRARAVEIAYKALEHIHFENMHFRRDIGQPDGDEGAGAPAAV